MKTRSGRTIRKRDIVILAVTIAIIIAIIVFCILKWRLVVELFDLIVRGKDIVQETVLSWGIWGELAIGLVLIFCFFFPFISSLPVQILCVMVYGVWHATLIIAISLAIAAQLLFLLEKNVKTFFYSKKQLKKQQDIEERIRNSRRNIHFVMIMLYIVPCIPFLVISSIACRSNMKWWKYALYTTIGPIPEIIVTLLLGDQVTSNSAPVVSIIILIFMILLVVLSLVFKDKMIYFIFKPKKQAADAAGAAQNATATDEIQTQDNAADITSVDAQTPDNAADMTSVDAQAPENAADITSVDAQTPENAADITSVDAQTPENAADIAADGAQAPLQNDNGNEE